MACLLEVNKMDEKPNVRPIKGSPVTGFNFELSYITHVINETLAECGIYGEEAMMKCFNVLKRLEKYFDLLPPCAR